MGRDLEASPVERHGSLAILPQVAGVRLSDRLGKQHCDSEKHQLPSTQAQTGHLEQSSYFRPEREPHRHFEIQRLGAQHEGPGGVAVLTGSLHDVELGWRIW